MFGYINVVNRPEHSQTGRCRSATCKPWCRCVLEQSSSISVYCLHLLNRSTQPMEKNLVSPVSTFPSFTVNGDDVFGVGGHPLLHVSRVAQQVPGFRKQTLRRAGHDTALRQGRVLLTAGKGHCGRLWRCVLPCSGRTGGRSLSHLVTQRCWHRAKSHFNWNTSDLSTNTCGVDVARVMWSADAWTYCTGCKLYSVLRVSCPRSAPLPVWKNRGASAQFCFRLGVYGSCNPTETERDSPWSDSYRTTVCPRRGMTSRWLGLTKAGKGRWSSLWERWHSRSSRTSS